MSVYLIIVLVFVIISLIISRIIYELDSQIERKISNNILILLPNMIIPILIYNKYEISMITLSYMMLIPFLVLVSIIDYRTSYVYDITILSGIIMQSVFFSINNFKGLLIGFVLSYIIAKTTHALGGGDVGFYSLCGFVIGGKYCILMMLLSCIIASIYGVFVLLRNTKYLKSTIPFTPFISLATILVMIMGEDMINIYNDILITSL